MPITNLTQSLNLNSLSNYYLNHPANNGMSSGYWYYYSSSAANNTVGGKIKPHRWGTALTTDETGDFLTIDGTIQLISESLNRSIVFHGGGVVRDGAGLEPQLNINLSDSFFFYHLGDLRATDNIGYWDYAYLVNGGSEWTYSQYHQHVPNVYEDYYDGRQVHSAGTALNNNGDKSFGYIQPTAVSVMGAGYTNIMGRVHTPTDGFAHNQHFDQELPATQNKDYMLGGIINGTSLRFHAFYISANGTQWDVFSRTYSRNLLAWTAEVNHGQYDLADPTLSQTAVTGEMDNFPVRASCGTLLGTDVYIPLIYNGAGGTFDLKTWKFESTNQILTNTITTQSLVSGLTQRPDCHLAIAAGSAYALVSDIANGGVDFYKYTGNTWTKIDDIIKNGTEDILRIHGFEFNTEDALFYALLSGNITGSVSGKNYSGSGVYRWSEGLTFAGYQHLTYTSSYGFKIVPALTTGYTKYDTTDGFFQYKTGSEPQGILETERILTYENASPRFFNKLDTDLGGSEYFYAGTALSDGRQAIVGIVEDNDNNAGGYDLLLAIYDISTNENEYIGAGGDGDDYFTGIIEDAINRNLWMVGYTKSYLAQKRDIKIHGFGRGLIDVSSGDIKTEWVDMVLDSNGNQYFAGNHLNNSSSLVAKYDYNFDLQWVNEISSSANINITDQAYGITLDNNNNIYVIGRTNSGGAGGFDSYVTKLNNSGSISWSKYFGTAGNEYGSSIATVTKSSNEYLVTTIVSGSDSIINILDTNGLIIEQNKITGFTVNRVRKSESETDGFFLLAGKNNASPSAAQIAKGQVLASGNMIKWVRTYSSGSLTTEAFDIKNTEPLSGSGVASGPKYHFVGSMGTEGFISKIAVDENAGVFTSTKQWATSISGSILTSLTNTPYTVTPSGSRFTYATGHSNRSKEGEGGFEGIITSFNYTGSRMWTTTIGHTKDEKLYAIDRDVTNDNLIVAGWSESHTDGRRTFNWRSSNTGYGTGNYHEKDFVGMQMWYKSSSLNTNTNNGTITSVTAPSNIAGGLSATSGSFSGKAIDLMQEFYDGGRVFDFFLAKISLDDIAAHKNTDEHRAYISGCDAKIEYLNDLFTFYQIGTSGDGTADDGNYFGYDLVFDTGSNIIYTIGQTSGDINKYNLGSSGIYDYILGEFDLSTEQFELYQNGSEFDEEMYALALMNDGSGSVAFVGRTTGTLGGALIGSYDIILGIYNEVTEAFSYFSTGSGAIDKAVNVHDVGNNTLALVFETAGTITSGSTSNGGLDIGVMTFNYSSSLWSTASYLAGSSDDEILGQEGKHSVYLPNSKRIAVVGKTLGTFADNDESFGSSDLFLGIFNLNNNQWDKHQLGTNGNDTGTGCFTIGGDKIVVLGFTDSSFEEPNNGIIATFDSAIFVKGKSQ
jgi:hypothetical protein